jgi:hypothetical protein
MSEDKKNAPVTLDSLLDKFFAESRAAPDASEALDKAIDKAIDAELKKNKSE